MNLKTIVPGGVICALLIVTVGCGKPDAPRPKASGGSPKKAADNTAIDTELSGGTSPATGSETQPTTPAAVAGGVVKPATAGDPSTPWGDLRGKFTVEGSVPAAAAIKVTKDLEFCGQHKLVQESLVVDASGNLANVVLFLYQKRGEEAPPVHPDYEASLAEAAVFDNQKCRFEPHIQLVRTGQKLTIGNKDPVAHNSKVEALANPPINPIIPNNESIDVTFENAERLPVSVTCSIHPWMQGWVVVQPHPYTAVSNKTGEFVIKNIPAGNWTFTVWHEKVGFVDTVNIGGQAVSWKKGRVEVEIGGGVETDLGEVAVPASEFE